MPSLAYRLIDRVAGFFGYSLPSFEDNPEAEQEAIEAARSWLTLIDEGKYGESWKQSVAKFRETVPQEKWTRETRDARASLGAVQDRKVAFSKYAASLPGSVEGEHVIIRFNTQFEHEEEATEMVTFAKAEDDVWRSVGGYRVK